MGQAPRPRERRRTLSISVPTEVTLPQEEDHNIRAVKERIDALFSAIGTEAMPETVFPSGNRNNSTEAAEYAIADVLLKLAKNRHKSATEKGQAAGIFGDEKDYVANETVIVWQSPSFSINVKKGQPSKMIGKEETEAAILKAVGPKRCAEIMQECMKERAATKQIIVSMK